MTGSFSWGRRGMRIVPAVGLVFALAGCPLVTPPGSSTPDAKVGVSKTNVQLDADEATEAVYIWNDGGLYNRLVWSATPQQPWLRIDPASGSSYGPIDGNFANISASRDLTPGVSAQGSILITAVGAATPPVTVNVTAQSNGAIFAGSNVSDAVAADFNKDGSMDFAMLNQSTGGIDIFYGPNAKGAPNDRFIAIATGPDFLSDLVYGDFTNDGFPDLVVSDRQSNDLAVAPGAETGFGELRRFDLSSAGLFTQAIALTDFDANGALNVVMFTASAGFFIGVAEPNAAGDGIRFTGDGTTFALGIAVSVAAGNVVGDSRPDIVLPFFATSGNLMIHENQSAITRNEAGENPPDIARTPIFVPVGGRPVEVAITDLNGDGVNDLVAAGQDTANGHVSTVINNGDGTFADAVITPVCDEPEALALGDFNGDGVMDVAVGCETGQNLTVLTGDGAGGLTAAQTINTGFATTVLRSTDWNGDGNIDLIAGDTAGMILPLLGSGTGNFAP